MLQMRNKVKFSLIWIIILYVLYFIFPYFISLQINNFPSSQIIYDSNNEEIWEIVTQWKYRHRIIDYTDEKYDFLKKVVISLEDRRFYYHSGIDFISFFRAVLQNLKAWKILEWASTIDSQVIRNSLWLNESRNYKKKIEEFIYALAINKKYSKNEILNLYLNNVYFWYLNYWFESASIYYFWKDLENLTKAEIVALVTIPKNSNNYDPLNKKEAFAKRFNSLLNALKIRKIISEDEYTDIKQEKLIWNTEHKNKLPYVVDFLKTEQSSKNPPAFSYPLDKGDLKSEIIKTTIDYYRTKEIEKISYNAILKLFWKNVTDYSVIVLDKKTNELKTMIWWIDYNWINWQVNSRTALRQAGSTIKPFTYYLAFKNLWLNPSSKILDLPISFQTIQWYQYSPKNYDLTYHWEVNLAQALSQSINIPAVKLTEQIWAENLLLFLKKVWITSLNKPVEHYWLALTLGVWEVSLYELTRAYSIFAHDWNLCDINIINNSSNFWFWGWKLSESQFDSQIGWVFEDEKSKNLKNCNKIAEKKYTDMVSEILTNRYFKLWGFPINSSLDFPDRNVFVKTGTSRNFRDNWAIWYTDNYIIWVWVGNKDASNMKWVSWASWAWEVFRNIVYYLEPDNIEQKAKENIDEKIDNYLEITSPLQNSVYSFDKSKNSNLQSLKIEFSTNYNYDKVFYIVDDEILKNEFWNLKQWFHKISVKLMKNWEIIETKSTNISVE